MYYLQRDHVLIVMLGGADKSSQAQDIAAALGDIARARGAA
ncbi:addiction module toxin RelE [Delftia acidovorans]|uniref:Addiction module toxin RelE n=1 Tax=Delftia acidovorans TaxID=80866 RepID=A0A7T2S914_DELAC|nr:addiction module toxin RelE [Delftia acidovorans]